MTDVITSSNICLPNLFIPIKIYYPTSLFKTIFNIKTDTLDEWDIPKKPWHASRYTCNIWRYLKMILKKKNKQNHWDSSEILNVSPRSTLITTYKPFTRLPIDYDISMTDKIMKKTFIRNYTVQYNAFLVLMRVIRVTSNEGIITKLDF